MKTVYIVAAHEVSHKEDWDRKFNPNLKRFDEEEFIKISKKTERNYTEEEFIDGCNRDGMEEFFSSNVDFILIK